MKKTPLPHWETAQLGIGLQFFNFFNHANFQLPLNDINDPLLAGLLATTSPPTSLPGAGLGGSASPRMIQLRAQLLF